MAILWIFFLCTLFLTYLYFSYTIFSAFIAHYSWYKWIFMWDFTCLFYKFSYISFKTNNYLKIFKTYNVSLLPSVWTPSFNRLPYITLIKK